ncbi:hypothetical protein [Streptomyces johnsoniae]|uniref:Gliding motility protein n=1 Tax=Streptomyces johnsoniae TaxID=3075532 RepID=A0ABU2SCN9_9ACTN|nr:hypothetical protein [Streptomyces sp. DSM 41886]MDT0446179.1 hypothetical protein [Streptomyces sp. DSM 41886]
MGVLAWFRRRRPDTKEQPPDGQARAAAPEAEQAPAESGAAAESGCPAGAGAAAESGAGAAEAEADADGVGIPKQTAATEAADSEAGEGAARP